MFARPKEKKQKLCNFVICLFFVVEQATNFLAMFLAQSFANANPNAAKRSTSTPAISHSAVRQAQQMQNNLARMRPQDDLDRTRPQDSLVHHRRHARKQKDMKQVEAQMKKQLAASSRNGQFLEDPEIRKEQKRLKEWAQKLDEKERNTPTAEQQRLSMMKEVAERQARLDQEVFFYFFPKVYRTLLGG